ncbi:MAG: SpoIID/LytB domain-containing protein [Hespellia sp.]|nr:SpoIID/LytB domain-containing protein [Hespellia sp.]
MRKFGAVLIVFCLLPCVLTVFVKGAAIMDVKKDAREYVETADGKQIRWEDYLFGRLAANIAETDEPETIKAQAVILRTQAARKLSAGEKLDSSYITMDEWKQKWNAKEFDLYTEKYERAIRETKREVVMYEDQLADASFHALSAGRTRSASEVLGPDAQGADTYLVSVDCAADKEAEDEMQIQTFSYAEVQKRCQPFLVALDDAMGTVPVDAADDAMGTVPMDTLMEFQDFEVVTVDSTGYVTEIKILGNIYPGEQFRQALGLSSSAFTLQDYQGKLRVTTMGRGHGFGMSQNTANEMAKGGATYEKILAYFFPGTNLQKNDEIFLNLE